MSWFLLLVFILLILGIIFIFRKRRDRFKYNLRKRVKWHDGYSEDNKSTHTDPEYKLVKLRKGKIKEVYNHNYLNPQQNFHEYGAEEEDRVVDIIKDYGFFTRLIKGQRGFFLSKYFNMNKGGFWVNLISSQNSSKDTHRRL